MRKAVQVFKDYWTYIVVPSKHGPACFSCATVSGDNNVLYVNILTLLVKCIGGNPELPEGSLVLVGCP